MLDVWREMGFPVAAEGFADRRYEPDGSLRPRKFPDALITNPADAAAQAWRLAAEGRVQTICVHSDTPGSLQILEAVAQALVPAAMALLPSLAGTAAITPIDRLQIIETTTKSSN
jgi:UPF0271 protein